MHWKSYIFFPLLATFGSRILLTEYACNWESCWDNHERCITLSQIEVPRPQGDKRVYHHTTGREYQQPASPKSALLEHERIQALERKEVNVKDRNYWHVQTWNTRNCYWTKSHHISVETGLHKYLSEADLDIYIHIYKPFNYLPQHSLKILPCPELAGFCHRGTLNDFQST